MRGSAENYRIAIRGSGMVRFLVENLASKNQELQTHCASAIFKCAEEGRVASQIFPSPPHLKVSIISHQTRPGTLFDSTMVLAIWLTCWIIL